jgi:RimJ/RimL family protein N-acetyltransferase
LELRRVRLESHFKDLRHWIAEPEIWQYMSFGQLTTPERLRAWMESVLREPEQETGLPFAIIHRESGRAIGSTSLYRFVPQHRRLELGRTWLARPFWRTGVNLEGLMAKYANVEP